MTGIHSGTPKVFIVLIFVVIVVIIIMKDNCCTNFKLPLSNQGCTWPDLADNDGNVIPHSPHSATFHYETHPKSPPNIAVMMVIMTIMI